VAGGGGVVGHGRLLEAVLRGPGRRRRGDADDGVDGQRAVTVSSARWIDSASISATRRGSTGVVALRS